MSPRVVLLTTYFRPIVGGVESNAERLARFLHGSRYDVRVVTKRITPALADREDLDGVPIERIGPYGVRSASGKWRMLPSVFRWLVVHKASYDVVCCVDYRGVGVAAIAARVVTGRPVVLQAQTPGNLLDPALLARPVIGAYRRADAFACISHALEREAIAAGVPAGRVHFLPNAVDISRFRPAEGDERQQLRDHQDIRPAPSCACSWDASARKGRDGPDAGVGRLRPANAVLWWPNGQMTPSGTRALLGRERHNLNTSVRFLAIPTSPPPGTADVVIQLALRSQGLSTVEALASGVRSGRSRCSIS
jgi:glycosyltransferase involved in cell wall biosynthesis